MTTTAPVNDELLFHFRELVKEQLDKGESFDDAWDTAERQFGTLRKYEDECRTLRLREQLVPSKAMVGSLVAMVLVIGWLTFEVHSFGGKSNMLHAQTTSPSNEKSNLHDLTGQIMDEQGKPLAGAQVLLILKTWPNNRFQQKAFNTKTDSQGQYTFEKMVPDDGQYAVLVTAVPDGYAFRSTYILEKKPTGPPKPIDIKLERASPVDVVVKDGDGNPIKDAEFFVARREPKESEQNLIYFLGSEPVHVKTGKEGQAKVNVLKPEDKGKIYIKSPSGDWIEKSFVVPKEGRPIEITL